MNNLKASGRRFGFIASFSSTVCLFLLTGCISEIPRAKILKIETGSMDWKTGFLHVTAVSTNKSVLERFETKFRSSPRVLRYPTLGGIQSPLIVTFDDARNPICLFFEYDLHGYTARNAKSKGEQLYGDFSQKFVFGGVVRVFKTDAVYSLSSNEWRPPHYPYLP